MSTLRHLIAAGLGVTVALSNIKPSSSQTTPSSTPADPFAGDSYLLRKDVTWATTPASSQSSPNAEGTADDGSNQQLISDKRETAEAEQVPLQARENPLTGASRPAPAYLNPDPNPLQFPTKPEEVRVVGTQPITLQQAIELARRNNQDLQVAEQQLQRSRYSLQEALSAELPSLDLNADVTRSDSAQGQLQNERLEQQQPGQEGASTISRSLSGQLELSYDVITSGRRSANIKAADRQVKLNQLEVERIDEQLQLDVANAYYDVQQADEQVRIAQSAVRNAQQSLRDAEALERAGVGTRFDVLRAQVQLANETQNLTQSLRDQQVSQRQLAQLLSLSLPTNISAADPVEVAGFWNLTLEESIVQAFRNRAELEQQLVQREINEQQRRVALAGGRPQVSVFGNYNVLDVFADDFDITDGYAVGARLRWNLYNGGATRARANQEEVDTQIAETQFADQRNQVRLQVEQAYYDLRANFENIQTSSVEVERSREALRLARLRFQAGVGTQSEVIDAESELTRSEGNRVRAILGYNRALATMLRAVSNTPTAGDVTISP
ncbi:TolC family protein [Microcoleus sp. FACHB-68]|uniref:TolC family protein n=1 Tax=Microcoleus sp. FACHB-68 TaxID=2692826 RepID=UPI00168786DC|nr:TolC family protein [Microcoleus sp. FACHB-68]MBD1936937.1 TolC family protein [Microcoleus sp. FACHB-68]